ncbi:MAG: hypothetical protein ACFFE8_05115 [Candidatus Heimdallarchaeota archaeon]
MKYCPTCGVENFEGSAYCGNCGHKFPVEPQESSPQPIQTPPQFFPPVDSSRISYGRPSPYIRPPRIHYMNLIIHRNYQYLINGSAAFAFGPIISLVLGIILVGVESSLSTFMNQLVDLGALTLFAFGIYSISQLEPGSLNRKVRFVPLLFILYAVIEFIGTVMTESVLTIPDGVSLEGLRTFIYQGLLISVIMTGSAFIFLIGAHSFTQWFEELIIFLGAPHNATTSRIRWCALCEVMGSLLLVATYVMFLSGLETLSLSAIQNGQTVLVLATLIFFVAIILQVAGGYKVFTELNNIKMGKYDGTYQQHIIEKYR